jgi:hypothetical protein
MRFEIFISLVVSGFDCDPEAITHAVGLSPSRTWRVGERTHGDKGVILKTNRWQLDLPFNRRRGHVLDDHIKALLSLVHIHAAAIAALPPAMERRVAAAVYDGSRAVTLALTRETITAIHDLAASLDIDYYSLDVA